jgi:hypothetical protein
MRLRWNCGFTTADTVVSNTERLNHHHIRLRDVPRICPQADCRSHCELIFPFEESSITASATANLTTFIRNTIMPFYTRLEDAAKSLSTTEEDLMELERRSWIAFTHFENTEVTYLRGHQQYRAKFVISLRDRLGLSPEQISKVLENQKPPYSLSTVQEILAKPA